MSASDVTQLLTELQGGHPEAAAQLLPLVYDELRGLAARHFQRQPANHTLQPTALVHEAFLKLVGNPNAEWKNRVHFFAVAATAMRQILVNHAESRNALKRGGARQRVELEGNTAV